MVLVVLSHQLSPGEEKGREIYLMHQAVIALPHQPDQRS